MNTQLNYMFAQQRSTDLQRAGAYARLARDVRAVRRSPQRWGRIAGLTARLAGFIGRFASKRPGTETPADAAERPISVRTAAWSRSHPPEPQG